MENSLLLESFIRKLDARYKVLSGDTVSTFRHQAHAEANQVRGDPIIGQRHGSDTFSGNSPRHSYAPIWQIALHLIEEPTPPMPRFLAAALEDEPGSLGAQIDAALGTSALPYV